MSSALTCEIAPGRKIGDGRPCFVIAEIGSNHNQDFDLAKKTIDAAAEAGVDAFQPRKHPMPPKLGKRGRLPCGQNIR